MHVAAGEKTPVMATWLGTESSAQGGSCEWYICGGMSQIRQPRAGSSATLLEDVLTLLPYSRGQAADLRAVMEFVAAAAGWGLQNLSPGRILDTLGLASLLAQLAPLPWSDLSQQLSPQASISLKNDPEFTALASRWREWHGPSVQAVVSVFNEKDVEETVSSSIYPRVHPAVRCKIFVLSFFSTYT